MGGCLGIVVIVVIIGLSMLLRGGDSGQAPEQESSAPLLEQQPAAFPTEAPSLLPTAVPVAKPTLVLGTPAGGAGTAGGGETAGGDTWTVILYQDADDRVLEQDIYVDLNEAERVGSTDKVKIVAQIDRYKGGFAGDGNWTGAGRFLVTSDDDLSRVGSELLQDLGEVNMADGRTLVDFVTWAMKNYRPTSTR